MYGTAALATGVFTDVVTASALCYFLHKMRTGHKTYDKQASSETNSADLHTRSDGLINTLTIYAVNTGALTR